MLWVVLLAAILPAQAGAILTVHNATSSIHGFATPITPIHFITAKHLASSAELYVDFAGQAYQATLAWQSEDADIAIYGLVNGPIGWEVLKPRNKEPEPQETLWAKCYLRGVKDESLKAVVVRQYYLGIDPDGDISLQGFSQQGCSGSGLIDSDGALVGVITAGYNPSQPGDEVIAKYGMTGAYIHVRSSHTPIVIAARLRGIPKTFMKEPK